MHPATQTMNENGSLKPFSYHYKSFHIKYPHRCITGKITAQIWLKLLLLVMKQLSLKMHHSLPPPFPHLYRLFPGFLLSFFSPPNSQYHSTGKRQQTLRVESYLRNTPRHISLQTGGWKRAKFSITGDLIGPPTSL